MKAAAAPLFADVADGPPGGEAWWLVTADGQRVRVAAWGREATRGTVLMFPGRTEYVEKYGRTARALLEGGYATLAIDWRGQGLASRMLPNRALGHVGRFPDYQQDVAAMVDHARAMKLPQPYFLLAHSMGGCIGLRALLEGLPVAAAAFSAPMWGIQISPPMRPVAWTLSSVAKSIRLSHLLAPGQQEVTYVLRADFADNTLTSDPAMFDYMRQQLRDHPELSLGGPSLNWLNEALVEMRQLSLGPAPVVPTRTFLGSEEAIVDPLRIKRRMALWPEGELIMVPGGRHELLMEQPPLRQRMVAEILELFERHRAISPPL